MNAVARIMATSFALSAAFANAVMAGVAYGSTPVVEDNGSDAGVFLLLAVGALIVIRSLANPKPSEVAEEAPDQTE